MVVAPRISKPCRSQDTQRYGTQYPAGRFALAGQLLLRICFVSFQLTFSSLVSTQADKSKTVELRVMRLSVSSGLNILSVTTVLPRKRQHRNRKMSTRSETEWSPTPSVRCLALDPSLRPPGKRPFGPAVFPNGLARKHPGPPNRPTAIFPTESLRKAGLEHRAPAAPEQKTADSSKRGYLLFTPIANAYPRFPNLAAVPKLGWLAGESKTTLVVLAISCTTQTQSWKAQHHRLTRLYLVQKAKIVLVWISGLDKACLFKPSPPPPGVKNSAAPIGRAFCA